MGENIGAAARVMANFGIDDLRIVAPRDGWPNDKARDIAAHADKLIDQAKIFANLDEAVADLGFLYATTARNREQDKPVIAPREIAHKTKTGFVFGPERTGLTNEEISICDEIISIPVSENFKSINLAQSVAVICYEVSTITLQKPERELAGKKELISFFEHLESELDKHGFFQEQNKKPGMLENIRTLFNRAQLSPQEVRTLRGMIKALVNHK